MMTDQLAGSWDQPSATIVLHSSKPSKVTTLPRHAQTDRPLSVPAAGLVLIDPHSSMLAWGHGSSSTALLRVGHVA